MVINFVKASFTRVIFEERISFQFANPTQNYLKIVRARSGKRQSRSEEEKAVLEFCPRSLAALKGFEKACQRESKRLDWDDCKNWRLLLITTSPHHPFATDTFESK